MGVTHLFLGGNKTDDVSDTLIWGLSMHFGMDKVAKKRCRVKNLVGREQKKKGRTFKKTLLTFKKTFHINLKNYA